MSIGLKAFSHVIFDEYICVALSEGILITKKEDLTCVEILYGWVVGFDEVLVAESNMTKTSKLKRWFSLEKNSAMSELGYLFSTGHAVWHNRAVWHDRAVWRDPEQFSSELNNILSHFDYAMFIVRWWLHEVPTCLTMYAYMVVLFGLTFFTRGNSVGGYRSLRRAVMGSISPNIFIPIKSILTSQVFLTAYVMASNPSNDAVRIEDDAVRMRLWKKTIEVDGEVLDAKRAFFCI
ncbi:hypothetical protein Tco_1309188 [Tanacetum coccineum]